MYPWPTSFETLIFWVPVLNLQLSMESSSERAVRTLIKLEKISAYEMHSYAGLVASVLSQLWLLLL